MKQDEFSPLKKNLKYKYLEMDEEKKLKHGFYFTQLNAAR